MGRRTQNHKFVKYIVMLDRMGQVAQRLELDANGRLLQQPRRLPRLAPIDGMVMVPDAVPPMHPVPIVREVDYLSPELLRSMPIHPKMRQKPCFMLPLMPEDSRIEQPCY